MKYRELEHSYTTVRTSGEKFSTYEGSFTQICCEIRPGKITYILSIAQDVRIQDCIFLSADSSESYLLKQPLKAKSRKFV